MKFLLLFIFIAVVWAAVVPDMSQDELAKSLAAGLRINQTDSLECIRKTEGTAADLKYFEDVSEYGHTEPLDMKVLRRGSCLIVCCVQKAGLMIGGEVQLEEVFKFFRNSSMPEESQMFVRKALRICKEQVTDTSDECAVGFRFNKCMYETLRALRQRV